MKLREGIMIVVVIAALTIVGCGGGESTTGGGGGGGGDGQLPTEGSAASASTIQTIAGNVSTVADAANQSNPSINKALGAIAKPYKAVSIIPQTPSDQCSNFQVWIRGENATTMMTDCNNPPEGWCCAELENPTRLCCCDNAAGIACCNDITQCDGYDPDPMWVPCEDTPPDITGPMQMTFHYNCNNMQADSCSSTDGTYSVTMTANETMLPQEEPDMPDCECGGCPESEGDLFGCDKCMLSAENTCTAATSFLEISMVVGAGGLTYDGEGSACDVSYAEGDTITGSLCATVQGAAFDFFGTFEIPAVSSTGVPVRDEISFECSYDVLP